MTERRILAKNTLESYEISNKKFINFIRDNNLECVSIYDKLLKFILHRRDVEKKRRTTLVRDRASFLYYYRDESDFTRKQQEQLNTIILNADEKNPRDKTFTKDRFTVEQAKHLINYLSKNDEEMFLIVYLALEAGGRRISEILNLRKQHITITEEHVIVAINKSKTEKFIVEKKGILASVNNIGNRLKKYITDKDISNTDYIFFNNRMNDKQIRIKFGRQFNKMLSKIKTEDVENTFDIDLQSVSFHSIRATYVTNAMENNLDTYKTMQMTGHRDINVFQQYDKRITKFAEKQDMYSLSKPKAKILKVNFGLKTACMSNR